MHIPVDSQDPRLVVHFLNRAGFGPAPGQVRAVLAEGLPSYVDRQLEAGADWKVEERIRRRFGDQGYSVTEMHEIYRGTSPFARKDLPLRGTMAMLEHFYTAKMLRAVRSQIVDRRQTFPDPRIISYANLVAACFGWDVEVHSHQHALSAHFEIAK